MSREGIVVVGSANVDLVIRSERLPAPGETVLGESFATFPGGKGANQAVACARLGVATRFLGRVGADGYGDLVLANLRENGVSRDSVVRDGASHTGVAMIGVDRDGQNSILVAPGANARVSVEDVESWSPFLAAAVMLLQLEVPLAVVERAARLARELGMRVILNPAPAMSLPPTLLASVDVLTPNRVELALLSGMPVDSASQLREAVRSLLAMGVGAVVVTLGEAGAFLAAPGISETVPGVAVSVVDTTGAGDAFNAGLAVALAEGLSLPDAARFANATGALATTALGAQAALPTRGEVERLLGAR